MNAEVPITENLEPTEPLTVADRLRAQARRLRAEAKCCNDLADAVERWPDMEPDAHIALWNLLYAKR